MSGASRLERKMAVGPSAPPIIPIACERDHVGTEDSELGRSAYRHQLRVGDKGREVGHRPDAEEDQGRIETVLHPEIEVIQHRTLFIDTDLHAVGKGNIADQYAEAYRHEEHRLHLVFDTEIEEEQAHDDHDQVTPRHVGETRYPPELLQVLPDESTEPAIQEHGHTAIRWLVVHPLPSPSRRHLS